ncbi:MAG TPA: class I SAM-dependent methyltransferase [Pyrinomonadaceae bacterium]|jgi:SAM-dependent methyltransferase
MKKVVSRLGRRLLFPGFDIHTRSRASLCSYWRKGARRVLDAGCGNGYFSYLAWKSGADVDAVSFEADSIEKAKRFFEKQARTGRLNFIHRNLYELDYPPETFDEIICYETIEHLMRGQYMINRFSEWLRPGGVLHLCAPNKLHRYNANIEPSREEDGWHVRQGYDRGSYAEMLFEAGLEVLAFDGVGPAVVCACDGLVWPVNNALGTLAAAPLFLLVWPLWPWFSRTSPDRGISIYVKAAKPLRPQARATETKA